MKKTNGRQLSKNLFRMMILVVLVSISCSKPETGLKDAFKDCFYIGVAVNPVQIFEKDSLAKPFIMKHFNSITSEDHLKWEKVHPLPGVYDFTVADSIVAFGERNGMFIVGHTLIWHSQTPKWVFEDSLGNPLSRDALLQRMKDHITTVVGRYKGRVNGWDVINEPVGDDGQIRKTKWYEIIGEDYIQKAFEYAREADPEAELYFNDYNIEMNCKREGGIRLIKNLLEQGVQIDGVGIQAHWHLDRPDLHEIDTTIQLLAGMGLDVMFTELDIIVVPEPLGVIGADIAQKAGYQKELNPYPDILPDSVQQELADRYSDVFKTFVKYQDNISRVTFWGLHDGYSWKNNWPIRGRSVHPLLFDKNYQPKPAYYAVMETAKVK
ncbi:MAG: endo-1,4-beta-xylanase [Bacteroidales bacterium]|nr:endo-1,4-beta-xylanase [Bacteroidales bacterium]